MTQDEVAILWKDANGWDVKGYETTLKDLERFVKLVAAKATAKEREACALICDDQALGAYWEGADACADRIRARGEA
jgi:hypothetical protein